VRFAVDLSVDALRRDFSVNALYQRCKSDGLGEVEDPTGGVLHLRQGLLHTTWADPDQVLKDDGLRILRAARFQAELGLRPTPSLLASARKYAYLLREIAPERLRDELCKVLMADFRYPALLAPAVFRRKEAFAPGTLHGLATIRQVGAWPFLFGNLSYDPRRASALGRLRTPENLLPMAGRLALLFCEEEPSRLEDVLQALRFSIKERRQVLLLQKTLRRAQSETMDAFTAVQAGREAFLFAKRALEALGEGKALEKIRALADELQSRNAPFSLQMLAVGGDDLLPLCRQAGRPACHMGALLQGLWQSVAEGALPNERGALITAAGDRLGENA
jgi:tRNA nucleotidyltransferase/poly(A) polymerase